jgi:hypothetical protein
MAQINFAQGVDDAGLAVMMADIIKGNLKDKPQRETDFNALNGNIYIQAKDSEVDMTMAFNNGSLTVHNGNVGNPKIGISTDSLTLLDLANIKIMFGVPFYFDKTGLSIIIKLLTLKLKIKGLIKHPIMLTRFTKLMSVK